MNIRPAVSGDAEAIRDIYNHEVLHTTAVFDLRPRSLDEQRRWLDERTGVHGAIVAEDSAGVVGFGSLSRYKDRPAYNTTVENSVYVDRTVRGQGIGVALLGELVVMARRHGFHAMIARIAGGNQASVAAHAKVGFFEVGVEREVGRKFGRWLDVVVMERLL